VIYTEYAMQQHLLAAATPRGNRTLNEPVDFETAANHCCGHLLTAIGLQTIDPHPHKASLGRQSASTAATAKRGGGR